MSTSIFFLARPKDSYRCSLSKTPKVAGLFQEDESTHTRTHAHTHSHTPGSQEVVKLEKQLKMSPQETGGGKMLSSLSEIIHPTLYFFFLFAEHLKSCYHLHLFSTLVSLFHPQLPFSLRFTAAVLLHLLLLLLLLLLRFMETIHLKGARRGWREQMVAHTRAAELVRDKMGNEKKPLPL